MAFSSGHVLLSGELRENMPRSGATSLTLRSPLCSAFNAARAEATMKLLRSSLVSRKFTISLPSAFSSDSVCLDHVACVV